jgi:sec-independent protein translocase protein TatA
MDLFQPTHLIVIAVVLLVLFGGRKLPELGKGLGEGLRGFREGIKGEPTPPAQPVQQQAAAPAQPAAAPTTTTETKQS